MAENLNTLNQEQQSFFKAQQRFASNLTELGDPIPADTPSYTYNTIAVQPDQAMSTATAKQEGLPSYVGAVRVLNRSKPDAIVEIICRSSQPTRTPPALPQAVDQGLKCPTGSIKVQSTTSASPAPESQLVMERSRVNLAGHWPINTDGQF